MTTIPTTEPAVIIAGDTVSWTKSFADYPASTYTLTYVLHPESGVSETPITFDAAADNDDHAITVTAATSSDWSAGEYLWTSFVTAGLVRYTLESGRFTVKPNPATVKAGTDLRSHVKKTLDAIEAVLEGRAGTDQEEYRINDRMLKRTPIADLLALRSRYLTLYQQELNADAAAAGRKVGRRYLMKL